MPPLDPRLQELLDHHEIAKTLATYCHGCDRCDEPEMASVYRPDSWDDHGNIKASGPDFARQMTALMLRTTESVTHLLGQSSIRVDGDTAGAETYFLAVSCDHDAAGQPQCNQLGGRYVDRLRREPDGSWKIEHRVVVRDWSMTLPLEKAWRGAQALQAGSRSNADPSYAVLGLRHGGHGNAQG